MVCRYSLKSSFTVITQLYYIPSSTSIDCKSDALSQNSRLTIEHTHSSRQFLLLFFKSLINISECFLQIFLPITSFDLSKFDLHACINSELGWIPAKQIVEHYFK